MKNRINTVVLSVAAPTVTVAVTKTFPFAVVEIAYQKGLHHFGENRIDEAQKKIEEAKRKGLTGIVWHMIGHVRSRDARTVASLFHHVDSVDSVHIAKKLDTAADAQTKRLHILFEVNLSGEQTKYGFDLVGWKSDADKLDHFLASVSTVSTFHNLTLDGLMTMAPYVQNDEDNRSIFRDMMTLSKTIRARMSTFGKELSMGTSCDYRVAIEEGATQIRLGEILFGPRQVS